MRDKRNELLERDCLRITDDLRDVRDLAENAVFSSAIGQTLGHTIAEICQKAATFIVYLRGREEPACPQLDSVTIEVDVDDEGNMTGWARLADVALALAKDGSEELLREFVRAAYSGGVGFSGEGCFSNAPQKVRACGLYALNWHDSGKFICHVWVVPKQRVETKRPLC
jgi:hypothetical protein